MDLIELFVLQRKLLNWIELSCLRAPAFIRLLFCQVIYLRSAVFFSEAWHFSMRAGKPSLFFIPASVLLFAEVKFISKNKNNFHFLYFAALTLTLLNATECTNGKNLLQVVAFSRQVMSPCLMQSVAFSRLGVWYTTWILLQQGWYEWVTCTVQQNPPLQSVAFSRVGTWYEG